MKRLLALVSLLLLAACTATTEQEDTQPSTEVPGDENTTNPSEPADEDKPEDNSDNNTGTPVDEPELEIDFPPAPENPAEPNLPECLLGAEPAGCAAPPEPIVITAEECPEGWELSSPEDADVPAMCVISSENNCPAGEWPEIALPDYCVGVNAGDTISPGAVINIYIDDDAPIGPDGYPTGNGLCPTHAVPSLGAANYLVGYYLENYGLITEKIVLAKGLYTTPILAELNGGNFSLAGACSAETRLFAGDNEIPAILTTGPGNVQLSGVAIRSLGHGVLFNGVDATINDVQITGGYSGLTIMDGSVVADNLHLINLTEDNSDAAGSDYGIAISGDSNLIISGLQIEDCRDGILLLDGQSDVRVSHGHIKNVMSGVKMAESSAFRADGLTIEEFDWHGLEIGGSAVITRSLIRRGIEAGVIIHAGDLDGRSLYIDEVGFGIATDEAYSMEPIETISLEDINFKRTARSIALNSGTHVLSRVRIQEGSTGKAFVGRGENTQISFSDLTIVNQTVNLNEIDTIPISQQAWGVTLTDGATLVGERLTTDRTSNAGIFLKGINTELTVSNLLIRDTSGTSEDLIAGTGVGLYVSGGATATVNGGIIENSQRQGVFVHGENSGAILTDIVIRDALESDPVVENNEGLEQGQGISVQKGAFIQGERLLVSDVREAGVAILEATADLQDIIINHTRVFDLSNFGVPFFMSSSADADVERIRIRGGYSVGMFLGEVGTVATMSDVWVERIKRSPGQATGGFGVVVTQGADLDAEYIFVSGTEGGAAASWMPDSSMRLGNAVLLGKTRESVEIDDFDIDDFDIDDFDEVEEVENDAGSVEIDDFDIDDFDIDDFDIDDFDRDGVSALWGASASISSGVVMGFSRAGVQVTDAGGTSGGASVELSEVEIVDNLIGVNVFSVENEEASVELSEVEFGGNGTDSSSEMMSVEEPPVAGLNFSVELEAGSVEMSSVE